MISLKEKDRKLFKRLKKYEVPQEEMIECRTSNAWDGLNYLFTKGQISLIRMKRIPKTPYDFSVLMHEIGHCTIGIMRAIGMPLSETSEEAYTYLQGYITYEILKRIK